MACVHERFYRYKYRESSHRSRRLYLYARAPPGPHREPLLTRRGGALRAHRNPLSQKGLWSGLRDLLHCSIESDRLVGELQEQMTRRPAVSRPLSLDGSGWHFAPPLTAVLPDSAVSVRQTVRRREAEIPNRDLLERARVPYTGRSGLVAALSTGIQEAGSLTKKRPKKSDSKQAKNVFCFGFTEKVWLAPDKLRGNIDAAEHTHPIPGTLFLKYYSDAFEGHRRGARSHQARVPECHWLLHVQHNLRDPHRRLWLTRCRLISTEDVEDDGDPREDTIAHLTSMLMEHVDEASRLQQTLSWLPQNYRGAS